MMNNKFDIGSIVVFNDEKHPGKAYKVVQFTENSEDNMFKIPGTIDFGDSTEYIYKLESVENGSIIFETESALKLMQQDDGVSQIFKETVNSSVHIPAPKFKAGDIVTIINYVTGYRKQGIVVECVNGNKNDTDRFEYHIADYDAPYSGYETYQEHSLIFKKHDEQWEKYYTEMVENYRQHEMAKIITEKTVNSTPAPTILFKQGDRVKVSSPLVEGTGTITEARGDAEYTEYVVRVDGERNDRIFYDRNLELV